MPKNPSRLFGVVLGSILIVGILVLLNEKLFLNGSEHAWILTPCIWMQTLLRGGDRCSRLKSSMAFKRVLALQNIRISKQPF